MASLRYLLTYRNFIFLMDCFLLSIILGWKRMKKKKPDDIDSITVLLVGDEKVGKTQIFNRIFNFEFDSKYEETTEYNSSKKRYI